MTEKETKLANGLKAAQDAALTISRDLLPKNKENERAEMAVLTLWRALKKLEQTARGNNDN